MRETELYPPVKRFLEAQGYAVKAEIEGCDVVAVRGAEAPVVVELKTGFTLQLLLQGIDRLAITDAVYIAIAEPKRSLRGDLVKLCRRVGLGLLTVRGASVEAVADPLPYQPRRAPRRTAQLLHEFARRSGDPNTGGSSRRPLMTAYRQDALRCARFIAAEGPSRVAAIRCGAAVDRAGSVLLDDVYGWFAREQRGVYGLSDRGRAALAQYAAAVAQL